MIRKHSGKRCMKILLITLCTAAASAGALVHMRTGAAWGWDWQPLDPPNYYSLTSISWADTANPWHYFYKDLSRQGGSVIDYTRIIKSVLFGEDFLHIVRNLAEQLGIDIINRTPLSSGILHAGTGMTWQKQQRSMALHELVQQDTLTGSTSFHTYEESHMDYDAPRNRAQQRREIATAAMKYANLSERTLADSDATKETVHRLMEAAANAQGETELRQITEQLRALRAADEAQITALFAAKVQLENDRRRVQLDEEIEWAKQAQDAKIIVTDPYNEERNAVSGYDRAKPQGFVRFK